MTSLRITQPHPYLAPIQIWYEETFPLAERRNFSDLLDLLACPTLHLCALLDQEQVAGFIMYWHWTDAKVLFIEHFVIDPARRGRGLGQQALSQLLDKPATWYLLEAELPLDTTDQRRIQFYERQGFRVTDFPYTQPPYRQGESPVPMLLFARPALANPSEFIRLSTLIKARVYEAFMR